MKKTRNDEIVTSVSLKEITKLNFTYYYELRCDKNNILCTGHNKEPEYYGLKQWVKYVIKENNKLIYLMKWNDKYVGYLHIDFKDTVVEIGYSIHSKFSNRGLGTRLVKECIKLITIKYQYIEEISAWVAEFNEHSEKCVLNNGFIQKQEIKSVYYEGFGKEFIMRRYIYRTKVQRSSYCV